MELLSYRQPPVPVSSTGLTDIPDETERFKERTKNKKKKKKARTVGNATTETCWVDRSSAMAYLVAKGKKIRKRYGAP